MAPKAIVLITTDEQHAGTLSCHGAGAIATPWIDSIGARGLSFGRAYAASPVCLPSRCSMATGLWPHRSRSYSNGVGASLKKQWPNVMEMCGSLGYRTSLHGKGHFMPCPYGQVRDITQDLDAVKPFYESLGFDHVDLQDDKNNSLWFYDDYSRDLERAGLLKACRDARGGKINRHIAGYFFPGPVEMHCDSWVGRKAVEHIRAADADQPHFMWVSFSGPHYPIDTHRDYYDRVDIDADVPRVRRDGEWHDSKRLGYTSYHGPGGAEGCGGAKDGAQKNRSDEYWREWRRMYLGNVLQIDEKVGEILQAVEDKWGDDVMVIFTCDHGDMAGHHDLWGKNGLMFDDIVHVPLLVRYPNGRHVGTRDELVSLVDLMPTIVREAGYEGELTCDGRELVSLADAGGRDAVLCETDGLFGVITREGGKYVESRAGEDERWQEFYDLTSDPHEFDNLIRTGGPLLDRCREVRATHADAVEDVLFHRDGEQTPPWYFSPEGA